MEAQHRLSHLKKVSHRVSWQCYGTCCCDSHMTQVVRKVVTLTLTASNYRSVSQ